MVALVEGLLNKLNLPLDEIDHKLAIIFGDYSWFDLFEAELDSFKKYGGYKAMHSAEGKYKGVKFLLASFGYGQTDLNRVVVELTSCGVETIILLNYSVPLKTNDIKDKDICLIHASVRDEYSSNTVIDYRFPAVSHPVVLRALRDSTKALGYPVRVVKSLTNDFLSHLKEVRSKAKEEVIDKDVDLQDWDSSAFLVFAAKYRLLRGIISCVGLYPNSFNMNGEFADLDSYLETRRSATKIALEAAFLLLK